MRHALLFGISLGLSTATIAAEFSVLGIKFDSSFEAQTCPTLGVSGGEMTVRESAVEATCISQNGRLAGTQLGLWSDEHIPGMRRVTDACHAHGSAILVQIHHAGSKTPKEVYDPSLAPSDLSTDKVSARAMTLDELHDIQQAYIDAALRAQKAGFDGVELHGAHGYLISQFMSPITNRRSDQYGGEIANRMRFSCEIVEGIRKACGSAFIIGYRMGCNEPTLENGIIIAKELERRGVDLLHVSAGISSGEEPKIPEGFPFTWIVYGASVIKKQVGIPVIAVNGIRTPQQAAAILDAGMADFAAVGKGMLVDAEWANKAKENHEIILCKSCKMCRWFVNGEQCPRMREARRAVTTTP